MSPGGGRGLAACSMRWDDDCKTVRGFLLISALFISFGLYLVSYHFVYSLEPNLSAPVNLRL